jgi:hypothetical protein
MRAASFGDNYSSASPTMEYHILNSSLCLIQINLPESPDKEKDSGPLVPLLPGPISRKQID